MMRIELYRAVVQRLKEQVPEVVHTDMWNRNVEYVDMDEPWSRPAVFVEFGPIEWYPLKDVGRFRGTGRMQLHVVTEWHGAGDEEPFVLTDRVSSALVGLQAGTSGPLQLLQTHTNHDHEGLVESILVFSLHYLR